MTVEFKLPELGENVKNADVVELLVAVGDVLGADQDVLEVETDKASLPIPTSVGGKVVAIHVEAGQTIEVGQSILTIDESAAAAPAPANTPAPAAETAPAPAQPTASAPATPAPSVDSVTATPTPAPAAQPASPVVTPAKRVIAAPSVRQFAREIGVDLSQVTPADPSGKLSVEDIKRFARDAGPRTAGATAEQAAPTSTREKLSKIRQVAAKHLTTSWQAPHVTLHAQADVTELEAMRQKFKAKAEASGGKLTVTAMFVKIAAAALKVFNQVNASLDLDKGEVELKHYYHIGIAADTPRGLVVPVIRDADQKSIMQIAAELTELSKKARDGRLTPDDMSGATFTVTNLGGMGIGYFTPIVSTPQVAILGMGRATMQPVYQPEEGGFEPKLMLPLSLSFDHRQIDGADGARFLQWLVEAVQNPLLLSMEG